MKEMLLSFATYNVWANGKLLETSLSVSEVLQQQAVVSSFPSLSATWQHIWDAESGWWQRIKLAEHTIFPSSTNSYTLSEIATQLIQQSKWIEEWVSNSSELQLQHVFAYQNTKKEQFKQPVWHILLHVFNHGTYHRGQVVTILRQLGVEKIPQTDFIHWSRKK
jgi:uncharacterized damage-inducible protein DinB